MLELISIISGIWFLIKIIRVFSDEETKNLGILALVFVLSVWSLSSVLGVIGIVAYIGSLLYKHKRGL